MKFTQLSKDLRAEANLSQKALSKKLGLSSAAIGHLETGRNEPTATTLIAYAKYFDVSADYLLGLTSDDGAELYSPPTAGTMHETLSPDERELLRLYRELSPYLKGMTMEAVKSWAKKGADGEQKKV